MSAFPKRFNEIDVIRLNDISIRNAANQVPSTGTVLAVSSGKSYMFPVSYALDTIPYLSDLSHTISSLSASTQYNTSTINILSTAIGTSIISPVRNAGTSYGLYYNPTDAEITYSAQNSELITPLSGASGIVDHDFSLGNVWNHSGISANFTANITNIPTTDNRSYTIVLNLIQSPLNPYYANAIMINGSSPDLIRFNPTSITPTADAIDRQTITIISRGGEYFVIVKYESFDSQPK